MKENIMNNDIYYSKISLFNNMPKEEAEKNLQDLKTLRKTFSKNETIMTYSTVFTKIGILISGKAKLICIDKDGEYDVPEILTENSVFGELFNPAIEGLAYIVNAEKECDVLFIDYASIIKNKDSYADSVFFKNLILTLHQKIKLLNQRINILSKKNIRQKLLAYFETVKNKDNFVSLPITLTDLSEFLCVDRCAMMREIKKMHDEGKLIRLTKKNSFLLKN